MSQAYSKHISAYVTPEMYQFLQLLAERHKASISDVVRQAVREHLDEQEDVMSSRSRLGVGFPCSQVSGCSSSVFAPMSLSMITS